MSDKVIIAVDAMGAFSGLKEEIETIVRFRVEKTINNTMSSGSATTLIESKTYENPQFLRMKDLMTKIK